MLASNPMHPNAPQRIESTRNACQAMLDVAMQRMPHLRMASLSTADGRPFALAAPATPMDAGRVAAMSSSLLALSESFSREALRGTCRYSLISTDFGVIATVRIPGAKRMHVLAIASDDSEMLAIVLRNALDLSERLAAILDPPAA
jgi:uncharacterized protein